MRVLITGIEGFVGGHLTKHLLDTEDDLEIHGTVWQPIETELSDVHYHPLDLRDTEAVESLIAQVQPQGITAIMK